MSSKPSPSVQAANATSIDENVAGGARVLIFKGSALDVVYCPTGNRSTLFVTFTNFGAGAPKLGFGELFIEKQGYSGLYFIQKDNHWWQTSEIFEAIAAVQAAGMLKLYLQRVGYGSSMGAYGAIMFSAKLELNLVIALSPQYSIQQSKVSFDRRWKRQSEEIKFICDDMSLAARHGEIHVFFDPFHPDAKHAALIQNEVPCQLHRVPFAGHPAGLLIAEAGLLKSTVLGLVSGSFSRRAFALALREGRRRNKYFYFGLARAAFASGRAALTLRAAELGLVLDNNSSKLWLYKALAENRLGDMNAAHRSASRCLEITPANLQAKSLIARMRDTIEKRR